MRQALLPLLVALLMAAGTAQGVFSNTSSLAYYVPPLHSPLADVCPPSATEVTFEVVAIPVPISYNHWGDFDPHGRLFVLKSQLPELLTQVANSLAAAGLETVTTAPGDFAKAATGSVADIDPGRTVRRVEGAAEPGRFDVSPLVQPFIVRAHVGECVRFKLTNLLPEPASMHIHRGIEAPGAGMALGADDSDLALPGETRTYSVFIPNEAGMEGAHFIHSHADSRFQTKHGLFGALVAEPTGSTWQNPNDGSASLSGQEAMIVRSGASDFREYVVIYHDEIELYDSTLHPLPLVSPYGEYGPGTKGINLRSEPFFDRFKFHDDQHELFGEQPRGHDKSQGYGSYTYGDPAHFIPRGYVGDPTKFRLVNAGPGQTHVHHLHGGGDRWRASPVGDDTQFDAGLVKSNPIIRSRSERIDVQIISPGESFNAEIEGGAGGVQQSVGDFLYHCHIAEHYVSGMWSFWRVFNTKQADLAELPDRVGDAPLPVNSTALIGESIPGFGTVNSGNLDDLVEPQLPAQGVAADDEAAVWDWQLNGTLYKGEPETTFVWPNYESSDPGGRPELLFNPDNGRLSYPHLKPHLGKRPPFAPAHGPAPYLGKDVAAGRTDGLCPVAAPSRDYKVVATNATVKYNTYGNKDDAGQVFIHAVDKPAILNGSKNPKSFVIRANQGDCVDITLTSRLKETAENHEHSKVNMHIHLVQFDIQASDGVITGLNYETSVRPATSTGTTLSENATEGDTSVNVTDPAKIRVGTYIGIGLTDSTVEIRKVDSKVGNTIYFTGGLDNNHTLGELVGNEFVRYRWYADVDLGMVYWHDHVDGLNSWRHGLFGGLVVEPADSEWRDPKNHSAPELQDGHVVDIVGPNGTYRELVLQFQEKSAVTPTGACLIDGDTCLSSFNLRSEPFVKRTAGTNPLNATSNGQPGTDILNAYPGDNVTIRLLFAGQANSRSVATFALTGHRFPFEYNNTGSRSIGAQSFGISSQHNLKVECGAGGCSKLPGDYLYYITQPGVFKMGAWGILRVHATNQSAVERLPDNEDYTVGSLPSAASLAAGSTVRHYDIDAFSANVVVNADPVAPVATSLRMFAPSADRLAIQAGTIRPMPLVIRANAGDLIEVNLTNKLTAGERVSISSSLVEASPANGLGIPVGNNPADTSIVPNTNKTYRWYAPKELGATYMMSFGKLPTTLSAPSQDLQGLYGVLVVEPKNSTWSSSTGMSATVTRADGTTFREHVLAYGSNDPKFMAGVMPYDVDVTGLPPPMVNYRAESLVRRAGGQVGGIGGMGVHVCQIEDGNCLTDQAVFPPAFEVRNPINPLLFNSTLFGDPETPILDATEGQEVVIRVVGGGGDQVQSHSLAGHFWRMDPTAGAATNVVDTVTVGEGEAFNTWIDAGPGGPGDYLWGSHREAFAEAGAWGVLRVD